eukprot:TRINITY_DN22022_c0_g2_i1.p1 TRINITY_DN22022_c0_g2~~TRINITY_DN22022_c0_g2_i1.p1  ORF type:complete len:472 (+),score=27.62 TRINITY_DN22022_c0_g2_i1:178-1416(+)
MGKVDWLTKATRNKMGLSGVHCAAANGQDYTMDCWLQDPERVKYFLLLPDAGGRTALMWGVWRNRAGVVKRMLSKAKKKSGLLSKVLKTHDAHGNTAVMYAAQGGALATAKLLLEYGGKPLFRDRNDFERTCLLQAAMHGQEYFIDWVLSAGLATVTQQDRDGDTALVCAVHFGHLGSIKALLKHGASMADKTQLKRTPLLLAAEMGHLHVVQWLMSLPGVDLNEVDSYQNSAFLCAALGGQDHVVKWLIEDGRGPLYHRNRYFRGALEIAVGFGRLAVVQTLLALKPHDFWQEGIVPYAINRKQPEVVRWLLYNGWGAPDISNLQLSDWNWLAAVDLKDWIERLQAPWHPTHHHLWPKAFQRGVAVLLWISLRHPLFRDFVVRLLLVFIPCDGFPWGPGCVGFAELPPTTR